LVVLTKNMSSSMGRIIPYIMENKRSLTPPARYIYIVLLLFTIWNILPYMKWKIFHSCSKPPTSLIHCGLLRCCKARHHLLHFALLSRVQSTPSWRARAFELWPSPSQPLFFEGGRTIEYIYIYVQYVYIYIDMLYGDFRNNILILQWNIGILRG
jgi:hypothetical protein